MALFGRTKEAERCCSGANEKAETPCCPEKAEGICCVKVLGSGCRSCHDLYEHAKQAVSALGLGTEVAYITDMEQIMGYGVMRMPALLVNDKVVSCGKVLSAKEVEAVLRQSIGA